MNYRIRSLLLICCALITFNAHAVSFTADGNSVRGIQWYDSELDIVVRQQADDGSLDELRNIKPDAISPEMFAIPDGYRTVESQLTVLDSKSAFAFGTTEK